MCLFFFVCLFVGSLGVALLAEAGQFSVQIVYEECRDQKRPKLPQILSQAHFFFTIHAAGFNDMI